MVFFKVSAALNGAKEERDVTDRNQRYERAMEIADKICEFDSKTPSDTFCFVARNDGIGRGGRGEIVCGIIAASADDAKKAADAFLKAVAEDASEPKMSEITLGHLRELLGAASRNEFIESQDDALERFGLDSIGRGRFGGVEYDESIIDGNIRKEELYKISEKLLCGETLGPELDRIYSGSDASNTFGHPVHYFIEADDRDVRDKLTYSLLEALYDRKRLKSRRCSFVDFRPGQNFSRALYDAFYKSCDGGAVVVRYHAGDDSEDEEYADSETETVASLCETMLKYRNRVLTVFCLPRACEKTKRTFLEDLPSVCTVTVKEDLADKKRSERYLRMLCKEHGIRSDKKLLDSVVSEKSYYPDELKRIFDEWYNIKMKTVVFPQYRDIEVCRREAVKKAPAGNAFDELNGLVGLSEAKALIDKALKYFKLQKIFRDKGIAQDRPSMHMVFTGNPGTAKTTVARLFARIMKENGVLSKGHLVEVGRGDLVGKYVGWTAPAVKEKFKAAMGGVLFIDEAYSLVEGRDGLFGDEAINTIVQEMENRRDDLVVIFAGYPREMERFISRNPGLRSRIAFHVPFADYSAGELCEIAKIIGRSKGVEFTDEAASKLSVIFEAARQQTGFGNGRYARNVVELSKMNQASRLADTDPDLINEKTLKLIEEADVAVPLVRGPAEKGGIGFAV